MPKFGKRSRSHLQTCDIRLIEVFEEVVKHFDCSVLCGHRGEEEQTEAYRTGRSQLKFPESKHNKLPAVAVDVAPYPIKWNDVDRFRYFAGFVQGIATSKGIKLRWGGDWDQDTELKDNNFNDLPHFEIAR